MGSVSGQGGWSRVIEGARRVRGDAPKRREGEGERDQRTAERQSRGPTEIPYLALRKPNPVIPLIVTGCYEHMFTLQLTVLFGVNRLGPLKVGR